MFGIMNVTLIKVTFLI